MIGKFGCYGYDTGFGNTKISASPGKRRKEITLSVIKSFLNLKQDAHVDIELYNREIDDAMKRIDAGQFTSHEDLEKEMESW